MSSPASLASAIAVLLSKSKVNSASSFADWLLSAPTTIANIIKSTAFQVEAEAMQVSEAATAATVEEAMEELRAELNAAMATATAGIEVTLTLTLKALQERTDKRKRPRSKPRADTSATCLQA